MLASWFELISKIPRLFSYMLPVMLCLREVGERVVSLPLSRVTLGNKKLKARWLHICACGISMQNTVPTTKMLTDLISDLITLYAIINPKAYVDLFRTLRQKVFFFLRGQNKVINWFI
jgi:hypothetical protein